MAVFSVHPMSAISRGSPAPPPPPPRAAAPRVPQRCVGRPLVCLRYGGVLGPPDVRDFKGLAATVSATTSPREQHTQDEQGEEPRKEQRSHEPTASAIYKESLVVRHISGTSTAKSGATPQRGRPDRFTP